MEEPNFESQNKEEYFRIVSKQLGLLLENIISQPLEDQDYEVLSRRATREVTSYIQDWLIKPLSKIEVTPEASNIAQPVQKNIKGVMQRVALFSGPLQELFAALKEVHHFEPNQYEQILINCPNIVEVLTNFLDKLESARR